MDAIYRISKKRFANEKKILNDPKKALHYATAFPSTKPGEELTWYFLIMGDDDSHYKGGQYIGKIVHHKTYPAKPPDYWMLTPNGRYTIDAKICLSNSSYHSGEWSTSWNIVTILIAFTSIWYDDKEGGISHTTNVSKEERRRLANQSVDFNIRKYPEIYDQFNKEYLSGCAPKTQKIEEIKPEVKPEIKPEIKVEAEVKIDDIKIENIKENDENTELLDEINVISNDEPLKVKKEKKSKKTKVKNEVLADDNVIDENSTQDESTNNTETLTKKSKTKKIVEGDENVTEKSDKKKKTKKSKKKDEIENC